jgi:protein-S-isoprenylcysteine O-methyltransferase Ste14
VFALILTVPLHFLLPIKQILLFPWSLLGLFPLVIGVILNLWADKSFKKHDTTVKPFLESTALITTGVFRITRNPMYLGMVTMILGVAILLGSAGPFLVVPILGIIFQRVFINPEERMLAATFGERFRQYRRRVRRWI